MNIFDRAATQIARMAGHPAIFAMAVLAVLVWAAVGPMAGYSDTWQLIINTSTTIVTFLMVFLIQNTQNRDSQALHLKIDELLRAMDEADTRLVDLEERSEQDLQRLRDHYKALAESVGDEQDQTVDASSEDTATDRGRATQPPRNQGRHRAIREPKP